jgi:phage tail tape-measure protein
MRATRHTATIIALCALGLLAACGTTPKERTTGGAAAGAATGAGIGALAGPPGVVAGALIGGGAGAATGAATTPNQVNLGKPPWTNPDTRVQTSSRTAGTPHHGRADTSQNAAVDRLNDESLRSAQQARTNP